MREQADKSRGCCRGPARRRVFGTRRGAGKQRGAPVGCVGEVRLAGLADGLDVRCEGQRGIR